MEAFVQDVDLLWSADLTVGCAALDERNARMLDQLARAASVIASTDPSHLVAWADALYDQFDLLLLEEERELTAADYPELPFHRRLHDRARAMTAQARLKLQQASTPAAVAAVASQGCAALGLWLPRHVVDADRLFFPYVDGRFRGAG